MRRRDGDTRYVVASVALLLVAAAAAAEPVTYPTIFVDVAGLQDAAEVEPVDRLTSAGQPDEAALRLFAESGYVAVIDLRGAGEDRGMPDEAGTVRELGMEYVALPIETSEAIDFEHARKLDTLLDEFDGPVLLHCGSGNRVGALLALRASLEGADDEAAIAYGKDAGLTRLEDVVRQRLAEQ